VELLTMLLISPSLVVASLALAVSLGGTGYAAFKLPANSVGTAQLRQGAVTSLKVKDASLLAGDFKPGQLPQGAPGSAGPAGPAGPKGDKGDTGENAATSIAIRYGSGSYVGPGSISTAAAMCLAGERMVGGGAPYNGYNYPAKATVISSGPNQVPNTWVTDVRNDGTGGVVNAVSAVICVKP
jgi:hypothetical protein